MPRLFLAVDLTSDVREKLQEVGASLRRLAPNAKWIPLEQAHVTLEFLGEWAEEKGESLREAMRKVSSRHAPFELTLEGSGTFGAPNHPKVFWLGIGRESDAL